jgi:SAM-dependent methyltransferase
MRSDRSDLPRRLNLGCGLRKKPDCLNVDLRGEPDLVLDLDRHPWPLPRGHFDYVWALDVVEHLADVPAFMEDVHAVLAPGGIVEITTPHFSCPNAYTDPTHRHHLGYFSFDYFTDASQWSFYTPIRFEIVERTLVFHPSHLDGLVSRLARRRPALYEKRFAWLWPAWFLIFKLRKV